MIGQVIKLDRSLPLIKTEESNAVRCNYSAKLSKKHTSVAIGDIVEITRDSRCDVGTIEKIEKSKTKLVRNDPVDRSKEQVLAANFDEVIVCCVSTKINIKTMLRHLVVAKNSGAATNLLLTKFDKLDLLIKNNESDRTLDKLGKIIAEDNNVSCETVAYFLSKFDEIWASSVSGHEIALQKLDAHGFFVSDNQENFLKHDSLCILLGNSGAGKSSLVNALAKKDLLATGDVREYDEKGRHTTVAREIVEIDNASKICDMPGLRALGLINCELGLNEVFSEIIEASQNCKFRNCTHTSEPGCKVKENINGEIVEMWGELSQENSSNSNGGKSYIK